MALRGGSFLTEQRPVFSFDGKFLLVCTGSTVSVLSVATGIRVAELHGHTDRVTSVLVVQGPEGAKAAVTQAWTSSLDGTIRLWNFISGTQIKRFDIEKPIVSMAIPAASKPSDKVDVQPLAFLSLAWEKKKEEKNENEKNEKNLAETTEPVETTAMDEGATAEETNEAKPDADEEEPAELTEESTPDGGKSGIMLLVRNYTGRTILYNLDEKKIYGGHLAKTKIPRTLVTSQRGNLVGMIDSAKLWIWRVPSASDNSIKSVKEVKGILLHPWQPLTVMAFDPTESMVAAGDLKGQVLLWKNIGQRELFSTSRLEKEAENLSKSKRPEADDDAEARTTFHWHSSEVTCLTFTSDGAYLISGGSEAVFVMWQMETGRQQFLPRLGAPLTYITNTPDPAQFLLSLADNSLRFLNAGSMKMERVIQGVKPWVACPQSYQWLNVTRAVLDPRSGRVVLPSVNVTLQFYDIFRDQHFGQVQVTRRNFIQTFDGSRSKFAQSTLVTHVAFSADASVMVTVDLRVGEGHVHDSSFLKFWQSTPGRVPFVLHTIVDSPHSKEILALAYHPSDHVVVTCSSANDFKIWKRTRRNEDSDTYQWKCSSAGSYKNERMHATAFSPDGTLLAVGANEYITLWNPATNVLLCVLHQPRTSEHIGLLAFIPKSHYLVATSYGKEPYLTVWDLTTLSMCWSYALEVESMSVDPHSSHFAILSCRGRNKKKRKGKRSLYFKEETAYVTLFDPASPVPVATWQLDNGAGGTLLFMPAEFVSEEELLKSAAAYSRLIVFNRYREYVVLDPFSKDDAEARHKIDTKPATADALSAFEILYGPLQTDKRKAREQKFEVARIQTIKPWGNLLNGPSHVLPPLTTVGTQLMESFLQKRAQ